VCARATALTNFVAPPPLVLSCHTHLPPPRLSPGRLRVCITSSSPHAPHPYAMLRSFAATPHSALRSLLHLHPLPPPDSSCLSPPATTIDVSHRQWPDACSVKPCDDAALPSCRAPTQTSRMRSCLSGDREPDEDHASTPRPSRSAPIGLVACYPVEAVWTRAVKIFAIFAPHPPILPRRRFGPPRHYSTDGSERGTWTAGARDCGASENGFALYSRI
jgi:hypothetical protein